MSFFNAISCNGIYEIDMHDLLANVNSVYNVSNKRVKHNLDSTYLWHYCLAHINKKRIKQLQHDRLLKSTDDVSFDQCESCLYGKMTKKPFPHSTERAKDLLGIIHTDVWGCEALVKRDTPNKLEQRSVKCIFIGYPKKTMGYYFYFPPENKIVVASIARDLLEEPANYKAAMLDPESKKWVDAMNAEMQSMMDDMIWVLVDLPPNCKTIRNKYIFKKKTDMDGNVNTYKAHLIAKGYTQTYMVDYEETFSPVADIRAIRILISIAAFNDHEIWQMDVKTSFLNGYLDEDIYMVQREGFVDPKHPRKVCKLQRSIYGFNQASRSSNKRFDTEIKKFGFAQNPDEPYVYQKASGSNVTFLILYVDDIIIMDSEYIVASEAAMEAVWINGIISGIV
ncbi:retrotransposon protein, putative, ty1-copia subclass [Tanacetum coccineum]